VLLVLTMLAVLFSLSWPSVLRYIGEEQIRGSAEAVRSAALGGRIKAVDTGLRYQFRYEPAGRNFVVLPYDPPENIDGSAAGISAQTPAGTYPVEAGKIGEQCQFAVPEGTSALGPLAEQIPREAFGSLPHAAELAAVAWSPPVLFSPDGTATDGWLQLSDDGGRQLPVFIRGLTGAVSIGPLSREAEP
jgi:hypothetical protein